MCRRHRLSLRRFALRTRLILTTCLLSILAALIVGASSYAVQSTALREQATQLIGYRAEQAAINIEHLLEGVHDSMVMLASDARVQAYLLADDTQPETAWRESDEVYALLSYTNALQYSLAYSYIIKESTGRVIYLGPSRAQRDLNFEAAFDAVSIGSADNPYGLAGPSLNPVREEDGYVFCMYQALYDIYRVERRLGVLCLALPESRVSSEFSVTANAGLSLYVVDGDGNIVSHPDSQRIATQAAWVAETTGDVSIAEGMLTVRKPIRNTAWYVAGTMPMGDVLPENARLMTMIVAIVALTIAACTLASLLLTRVFTKPFQLLRRHMSRVSHGDFTSTIHLGDFGPEYGQISQGFNAMSGRIGKLMEEAREASIKLKDSELRTLKAQINPHFLYNTLDSIHWMAALHGEQEISRMVLALAQFYRVCLGGARELVPLAEELRHVTSYLTIQRIRYSDVLESDIHVAEGDLMLRVPSLILQPLVENSIYHGLKGLNRRGMIRIRIRREADALCPEQHLHEHYLHIEVTDDGRGMIQEEVDALRAALEDHQAVEPHGLMNVHRRIRLLCGEAYGLTCQSEGIDRGSIMRLRLPILTTFQANEGEGSEPGVHSAHRG